MLVSLHIYDIIWVGLNWILPLKFIANDFDLGSNNWKWDILMGQTKFTFHKKQNIFDKLI